MQLPLNKLLSTATLALTCVIVWMVSGVANLNAQGWEYYFGGAADEEATAVVQTASEGFTITGFSQSFGTDGDMDVYLARVDVDGNLVWEKGIDEGFVERGYDLVHTADGGFLIAGAAQLNPLVENFDGYLLKVDTDGNIEWSNTFGGDEDDFFYAIHATEDGGYILTGRTESFSGDANEDVFLVKTDANGQEIWSTYFGGSGNDRGNDVTEAADGSLYIAGTFENETEDTTSIYILKTDASGAEVWSETFGDGDFSQGEGLILDSDGNLVIIGQQNFALSVLKTDLQGQLIWSESYNSSIESLGLDIVETSDQQYAIVGVTSLTAADGEILLAKINAVSGEVIWEQVHGRNSHLDFGTSLVETKDNGFVVAGYNSLFTGLFNDVTLLKANSQGDIFSSYIQGKVFFDNEIDNCQYDAGESGLDDWLVEVVGETNTYYTTTDADGSYSVLVDTGSYDINLIALNAYWEACVESYNGVSVSSVYDTVEFDFPVHTEIDCPLMSVAVSAPFVLPCTDLTYTTYYANQGPAPADNVQIELLLDDELTYVSSDIPVDQQIGDSLFIFELGTVAPGETGTLQLIAAVDCETEAGQAVFATASISPDSICVIDPEWDEASLAVDAQCASDSVRFGIENIGVGDMSVATNYIVIEDEVMAINQPVDLDSGDSLDVSVPAIGTTLRLIAEQPIGHPFGNYATVVVEGCTDGNDEVSIGYVIQFPEDEAIPFVSTDVQEALDPQATAAASLRGYPKGYLAENLITNGTQIDYQIFFQNTGLDTIYRVVVRDTLSEHLDLTSLRAGAASHPYDFVVYEEGYVKFIFDDIVLPPQSVNPDESFGSFTFSVNPKADRPEGTIINNRVALYVGFEEPVLSNTVFHTIGGELVQDFVLVNIERVEIPGARIRVYPNPVSETAILEVDGIDLKAFELNIIDLMGRTVRTINGSGNVVEIQRNDMPRGTYILQLISEGQLIGTGKIVVQ